MVLNSLRLSLIKVSTAELTFTIASATDFGSDFLKDKNTYFYVIFKCPLIFLITNLAVSSEFFFVFARLKISLITTF